MRESEGEKATFRFGLFEADTENATLTRNGVRVKIQEQPFRMLVVLLEHPGDVVTREELRQALWPEGTFVDFDGSLNVILKRLRAALDDDPDHPRYIQTLPRRGYRFIAPVSAARRAGATNPQLDVPPASQTQSAAPASAPVVTIAAARPQPQWMWLARGAVAAVLVVGGWLGWRYAHHAARQAEKQQAPVHVRTSVAVLGFRNLSGRESDAWLGAALAEMLGTELAGGEKLRLISGEEVAHLHASSPWPEYGALDRNTAERLGQALDSDILLEGSYVTIGPSDHGQLRVDVRMQNSRTGEVLTEAAQTGGTQDLFHVVTQLGSTLRSRLGVKELASSEEAGVLASLPMNPEAARFYALGVTRLREFDALAAKDLLEQAAQADPKFSLVHSQLAAAWAQLGNGQKRRAEARKALDLAIDLPRAQHLLVEGEYDESLGRPEAAAAVYHALFEVFPDNVEYGLRLAGALVNAGHGSRAQEVIRQMRRLPPPSSGDPRIDLADAKTQSDTGKQLVLIRTAMSKAQQEGKKLVYALASKSECMALNYTDHPEQAFASCESAYDAFTSAGNRLAAADCLRTIADTQGTQGHFEQAIATYQRALDMLQGLGEHEKTGAILNNMAINYENEGNLNRAEQLYHEARNHFQLAGERDNESTAVGNIADILYMRGNLPAAEKQYREALQIAGTLDNVSPGYYLYRLADLKLTRAEVDEARKLSQQAIDLYLPTHGSYQYLTGARIVLGETLKAAGDLAGARSQFEQTLAMRQTMGALGLVAESQAELAGLDLDEGKPAEAEALLRTALKEFEQEKSDPDAASAYMLLSDALMMEGKLDEMRKAAERGDQLSRTSQGPALKLTSAIQRARVELAEGKDRGAVSAVRDLQTVAGAARRLGYVSVEYEARLALGEWEARERAALGQQHLRALAADARAHGLMLIARRADTARNLAGPVEQARSAP